MASFRSVSRGGNSGYARSGRWEETTMEISGFASLHFKVGKILENRFKTKMNFARIKYSTKNPIEKVACVLNAFLIYEHNKHGNVFNYMKTICDENEVKLTDDGRYWIYDSRKHDNLPKNTQELNKFTKFVTKLIDNSGMSKEDVDCLKKNIYHTSSILIMFLTIERYYYKDVEISKLSELRFKGKWTVNLIFKEPIQVVKKERLEHNKYRTESFLDVNVIPKQEKKVAEMLEKLEKDLDVALKNEDNFVIHKRISENMTERILGSNKYKKVNKFYQEYQKEKLKLAKIVKDARVKTNWVGSMLLDDGSTIEFKKVRPVSMTSHVKPQKAAAEEEEEEEEEAPDNWEDVNLDDFEDNTAW